jgi:hypothetical protein
MNWPVYQVRVNLFNALAVEFIRGFGLGIQYTDEWFDENGPAFVAMLELGFIRFLFFWYHDEEF